MSRLTPSALFAVLAVLSSACGPSDAEIQDRIDVAVSEALDTTTTATTLAPTIAPPTCREYRDALAATEVSHDAFLAIERRLLSEALEEYEGLEIADGWLGDYVYWSAEGEVAEFMWRMLTDARPPGIVQGLHADLVSSAWAHIQAVSDVWVVAAMALPGPSGPARFPTSSEWESLLDAADVAFRDFESARVVARATCST